MNLSKNMLRNIIIAIFILIIILAIVMFWKQYKYSSNNNKTSQNATNSNVVSNASTKTLPALNINFQENEELKTFLSYVVYFNARNNGRVTEFDMATKEDFFEGVKLNIACELVASKMNNEEIDSEPKAYEFKMSEVNKAIKEFMGEDISEPIGSNNTLLKYDESKASYVFKEAGDATTSGYIVKILNQTNADGIYRITLLYSYPTEGDIIDNNIDNYECYRTVIELKVNEDYEYSKYQLVGTLHLESVEAGKIGDHK